MCTILLHDKKRVNYTPLSQKKLELHVMTDCHITFLESFYDILSSQASLNNKKSKKN